MKKVIFLLLFFVSDINAAQLNLYSIGVNCDAKKEDRFAIETEEVVRSIKENSVYNVKSYTLLRKEATKENCINLFKNIIAGDLTIIYVSAHGSKIDNYFFYPYNSTISSTEIIEILKNFHKELLIIMDTCHSAAFVDDWVDLPNNISIVTACETTDTAYVWGLSKEFIKGLIYEADENNDKIVTFGELFRNIKNKLEMKHKKQKIVTKNIKKLDNIPFGRTNYAYKLPIALAIYTYEPIELKEYCWKETIWLYSKKSVVKLRNK